jgi:hypothetical protein
MDIDNMCVYNGITCAQNTCESFADDLNLCEENTRCVVISGECHENPCNNERCDPNLCLLTNGLPPRCDIDPCSLHKLKECESSDSCVLKVGEGGQGQFCKSGGCGGINEKSSCGLNKKCVYTKEVCAINVCRGLNVNSCKENAVCFVDDSNSCVFDSCSEGSGLNDEGLKCSSLEGCGYEAYDDICKVSTSKFSSISVGTIQGIV